MCRAAAGGELVGDALGQRGGTAAAGVGIENDFHTLHLPGEVIGAAGVCLAGRRPVESDPPRHDPVRLMALAKTAMIALLLIGGCALSLPRAALVKPASPPLYQAPPDRVLTSALLDFSSPLDATFIQSPSVRITDDPRQAGNRVLVADGGVRLNLTSLVRGRDLGGVWDVIGLRIWSDVATPCDVRLAGAIEAATRFDLPARNWTTLWLHAPSASTMPMSTTARGKASTPDDHVSLTVLPTSSDSRLLIDDVALAQSKVTASQSIVPRTGERWQVARDGLKWIASVDGRSIFELPAAPFVDGGYRVLESDPTRALFVNGAGSTLCIDRTGRLIEDSRAKLDPKVLKFAKAIAENASPASIEVVGDEGRIERALPGDANNDGYDERRGVYGVHVMAGRVALRLTPNHATVKWPVLEVYDMPPGDLSVWLDGEIIPWAARADDGRVIVELPVELERPVKVEIRAK